MMDMASQTCRISDKFVIKDVHPTKLCGLGGYPMSLLVLLGNDQQSTCQLCTMVPEKNQIPAHCPDSGHQGVDRLAQLV